MKRRFQLMAASPDNLTAQRMMMWRCAVLISTRKDATCYVTE